MFSSWRLRTRLIVAYVLLIVLGFSALALLAGRQLADSALTDYQSRLEAQATLVGRGLAEVWEHTLEGDIPLSGLQASVETFANEAGVRITLLDVRGHPIVDSTGELPEIDARTLPEIQRAVTAQVGSDIRSEAGNLPRVFAAAAVYEDRQPLGFVWLSTSLAASQQVVVQRWLALGAGVFGLAVAAAIVSLWLANSFTQPLEALRQAALKMAAGDLSQRLPETRQDEIGELSQTFNYLAGEVESMLEEQRAFASNASHELRTPLTAIRLRSEALRAGTVSPEEQAQYIAEIDDEVVRLGRLVDDLLLLSRLEAGRLTVADEQVDAARLAQAVIRDLHDVAQAKGIRVTIDAPADLPPVQANYSLVRVAFRNVLENALKYTPTGGHVNGRIWSTDGRVWTEFRDSGQGITSEELTKVTHRFYRADKAHTRENAGSGLGLSLVQSVMQVCGGELRIESAGLGKGTTVTLGWVAAPRPA